MIYSILLFRLHKCDILLDSYKNKIFTSVEFDTMKGTYVELSKILFTEAEFRCTMVMVLVHNNGEVDNKTIVVKVQAAISKKKLHILKKVAIQ